MISEKNQPFVSIVIPVYNGGEYFPTCIESIMNQTYQNWELIINNNFSEDDTLKIAHEYAGKDDRIKVFDNDEFAFQVLNWNIACSHISENAKYLKVLGADDWLFPESIEKMVEVFEMDEDIGICSSYRLNDKIVDMDGLDIWDGNVYDGKNILYRQLDRTLDISGSITTVMWRVDHLKRLDRYPKIFDETTFHMDTELEYEVMNMGKVGFVFQVLSYTRRHEEAGTVTVVGRYNTLLQLNERSLYLYKKDDKKLNKRYKICRLDYAYFLLLKYVTFNYKTIKWHKKYIERPFKWHEYILALILRNKLTDFILNSINRIRNIITGKGHERITYKLKPV